MSSTEILNNESIINTSKNENEKPSTEKVLSLDCQIIPSCNSVIKNVDDDILCTAECNPEALAEVVTIKSNNETVCDKIVQKDSAELYTAVPTYDWVFDKFGSNTLACDKQMCMKKHRRSGSAFAGLSYYGSGRVKPVHRRTLSNITTTGSVYSPTTVVMLVMNNNKDPEGPKDCTKLVLNHCKVGYYFIFSVRLLYS